MGKPARRAVSQTANAIFVLFIFLIGGVSHATAQDSENSVTLIENSSDFDQPLTIFIKIWCQNSSCPGLELKVTTFDENYTLSDPNRIEISFVASGQVDFLVIANSGNSMDDLLFEMSQWVNANFSSMIIEGDDWLDNIPSPGITVDQEPVDSTWDCPIDTCHNIHPTGAHWVIGSLIDGSDKDSIEILGDAGDIIEMPVPVMPESVEIEFWLRNDSTKTLLEAFEPDEDGQFRFNYPEDGRLWLRIKQLPENGFAAYGFYILRHSPDLESSWGELAADWGEREPILFPSETQTLRGWVSFSDTEGDTIRVESASRMGLSVNCWDRSEKVNFEVFLISSDGTVSDVDGGCTNAITTNVDTVALEFRMTSETLAEWNIALTEYPKGDAGAMGDAPDRLWVISDDFSNWPNVSFNETIEARMSGDEFVDVFAFEVTSANGSKLHIDADLTQPVTYQIFVLNQETWSIENASDGGLIDAPYGIHAIRVEKIGDASLTYYDFKLIDDGEIVEIDPGLFTDQSNLFTDYYIFAGIFLLAPAVLVIFWNRNRWRDGINQIEIEQHELRRLRRLRERLTALLAEEDTNEQVIDSALHQLGDSPWQAVVEDWGGPLLRHNTEKVEICAWRINEGKNTMLIGIRIAESPWELAAMRVYAPEGASVSIAEVSPKHLFNGDEIFLDTLSPLTSTFLRLSISGEPSNIGFHLSGLVNGEPLAAVPNRAIDWS